jgi:phosphate transport system substrate-binding protein
MRIIGAGSTFAAPTYAKWGDASSSVTSIKLNYHTIGSGAGINQVNNRTVDSAHPICPPRRTSSKRKN